MADLVSSGHSIVPRSMTIGNERHVEIPAEGRATSRVHAEFGLQTGDHEVRDVSSPQLRRQVRLPKSIGCPLLDEEVTLLRPDSRVDRPTFSSAHQRGISCVAVLKKDDRRASNAGPVLGFRNRAQHLCRSVRAINQTALNINDEECRSPHRVRPQDYALRHNRRCRSKRRRHAKFPHAGAGSFEQCAQRNARGRRGLDRQRAEAHSGNPQLKAGDHVGFWSATPATACRQRSSLGLLTRSSRLRASERGQALA